MANEDKTVDFHYIKNSDFKTVLADGTISSLTPAGYINLNFYLERFPIPDTITRKVKDGIVGEEIGQISNRNGIIREVNVGVVLDIETAKGVAKSLNELISKFDEFSKDNKA